MATRVTLSMQQQDVLALVAEPLGDPGRGERGAQPHQRRLVGGRDDHDGARQALGAEVALEELAHLAAALTDQREDADGASVPRVIIDSSARLADARAGEDAEPLAAPAGHQRVEGPHAKAQLLSIRALLMATCGCRPPVDVRDAGASGGPPSIGRPSPSSTRPSSAGPTGT